MSSKAVFTVTNIHNNKRYVGISDDIELEWFNIKRDLNLGLGIHKMKEDFEKFGESGFKFQVVLESDHANDLNRKESEVAYEYDVWLRGYNSDPILDYRTMPEERLSLEKLNFYHFINHGKKEEYTFPELLSSMKLSKNDLQILLKEITFEEMNYFKTEIQLRKKSQRLNDLTIKIKSL